LARGLSLWLCRPVAWLGAGRQVNPATVLGLVWAVRSRVGSAARSLARVWATSQPSYGARFGVGCASPGWLCRPVAGSGLGDKSTQLRCSVWCGLCVAGLALPPGCWLGAGRQVNPATGFGLAWAVRRRSLALPPGRLARGWATSQPSYGARFGVGCASPGWLCRPVAGSGAGRQVNPATVLGLVWLCVAGLALPPGRLLGAGR
jgi:hypothetical protein